MYNNENIAYPVRYIYGKNCSHGLLIYLEKGRRFFEIEGKLIASSKIKPLKKIAQKYNMTVKKDELTEFNIESLSDILSSLSPKKNLSRDECNALLNFFDTLDDMLITINAKHKLKINDLLNKLFYGCNIPFMRNKLVPPVFSKDEIKRLIRAFSYGKKIILKYFFN